jgi:hypothetical protein
MTPRQYLRVLPNGYSGRRLKMVSEDEVIPLWHPGHETSHPRRALRTKMHMQMQRRIQPGK